MAQADEPKPRELIAELTHRCPLGCPYCSNPLALEPQQDELDVATWSRVFNEATVLGVQRVKLSGGEPGMRRDLVDIVANAREAGLRTALITSGVGVSTRTLRDLWEAGLEQVQVSFQDSDAVSADHIAGRRGAFQQKYAVAAEAVRLGLPLTVEVVLHRANIDRVGDMVDLAVGLKAGRIRIACVQDVGWARKNRDALAPTSEQRLRAVKEIEELRRRYQARIEIDAEVSDADWIVVTPSGRVLPCQAGSSVADLEPWSVCDHSLGEILTESPAFQSIRDADARGHQTSALELAAASNGVGAAAPGYSYRRM